MGKDLPQDRQRRRLLGRTAAGGAFLVLASGVRLVELALAKEEDDPASAQTRWGLLVDTSRCASGCDACESACNEEHALQTTGRPRTDPQWIRKADLVDEATGRALSMPLMCQHCEEPPCVDVCPTGASFRRADGMVLVDKHICIGCRYCMMACPFKARSFVHEEVTGQRSYSPRGKGTVESCTFCVHRVGQDRAPACVERCTDEGHGALVFGDLNDLDSSVSQQRRSVPSRELRPDLALSTGVRYSGV